MYYIREYVEEGQEPTKQWTVSSAEQAIETFESVVNYHAINEPYVEYASESFVNVGFTYADTVVCMTPVPQEYLQQIDKVMERIAYKMEVDSIS